MKRYKLLQRLLLENRVTKVGEIIKQGVGRYNYFEDGEFIKDKVVENNPEWFEEIKEIEVNLSYTPKSIYVSLHHYGNKLLNLLVKNITVLEILYQCVLIKLRLRKIYGVKARPYKGKFFINKFGNITLIHG